MLMSEGDLSAEILGTTCFCQRLLVPAIAAARTLVLSRINFENIFTADPKQEALGIPPWFWARLSPL